MRDQPSRGNRTTGRGQKQQDAEGAEDAEDAGPVSLELVHQTHDAVGEMLHVKVDQQTDSVTAKPQVRQQLGPVDRHQLRGSLELDDHGIVHEQVQAIAHLDLYALPSWANGGESEIRAAHRFPEGMLRRSRMPQSRGQALCSCIAPLV